MATSLYDGSICSFVPLYSKLPKASYMFISDLPQSELDMLTTDPLTIIFSL